MYLLIFRGERGFKIWGMSSPPQIGDLFGEFQGIHSCIPPVFTY